MANAASSAWRGCSGSCSGAPQKAMMASPMYLSMVPRWVWMARVMLVRYSFISRLSSLGPSPSEMLMKSRTSANITVSSRLSLSME